MRAFKLLLAFGVETNVHPEFPWAEAGTPQPIMDPNSRKTLMVVQTTMRFRPVLIDPPILRTGEPAIPSAFSPTRYRRSHTTAQSRL
jgi:hypothetical protein